MTEADRRQVAWIAAYLQWYRPWQAMILRRQRATVYRRQWRAKQRKAA